jgi:hypothetical protein
MSLTMFRGFERRCDSGHELDLPLVVSVPAVEFPVRKKRGLSVGIDAAIRTRYPSTLMSRELVKVKGFLGIDLRPPKDKLRQGIC